MIEHNLIDVIEFGLSLSQKQQQSTAAGNTRKNLTKYRRIIYCVSRVQI